MLKYHVAVCDDEKSDLDGIVQSVQQYDVQGCFDIETYLDGNELLSELQMQKKSFDLLLLDIEMPSNGFQLAQSLIQMEKHPLVVFVTKRHEYAVQGYGVAFRYLVKPLDQTLFAAVLELMSEMRYLIMAIMSSFVSTLICGSMSSSSFLFIRKRPTSPRS